MSETPPILKLKLALVMVAVVVCAPAALGSTRFDLNGDWKFSVDPEGRGVDLGWPNKIPDATERVTVPHTWNIGKYDDYEGTAWYFKSFDIPDGMLKSHVELHFGATFYASRVWLNGVELGQHEGGHTAYYFDLTPHLRRSNLIAVRLNNQPGPDTIPGIAKKLGPTGWYDWWHYGGIVRDVWLSVNGAVLIRRQQIRVKVEGSAADVTDQVFIENTSQSDIRVRLTATVLDDDGAITTPPEEKRLVLKPGSQQEQIALHVAAVKLWHFDHPNLYRLRVELVDEQGKRIDSLADSFGARRVEIRDRHLYLNGERVRLSGMTRHEDSPWEGLAESSGTIKRDYDELKLLQVTLTRPVHYPQNPLVLDYCDRNGILLIPEIPMWQFSEEQMSNPKVVSLARQMMREMIEQDFNHPSIFAWSACNESASDTPGGRAYFKSMYEMIKSLDPDRYVSFANDRVGFVERAEDDAAGIADFIMLNQYFGTWQGAPGLLEVALDRINRNYPNKMLIVSEFGAASIFAPDSEAGDQLRVKVMREQLKIFSRYDWIAGAIFWCYQDYKSHRNLWPGEREGYVEMGVVDENRQRRPSFEVWRRETAPARMSMAWKQSRDYPYRPIGFHVTIDRRPPTEIPAYDLRGYRLAWEVRTNNNDLVASGHIDLSDIGSAQTIERDWQPNPSKSLKLILQLYRPTEFPAGEKVLEWWEPRSGSQEVKQVTR
jgi:beta-galactosidase/beta-glucuronidase